MNLRRRIARLEQKIPRPVCKVCVDRPSMGDDPHGGDPCPVCGQCPDYVQISRVIVRDRAHFKELMAAGPPPGVNWLGIETPPPSLDQIMERFADRLT